MASTITPTTNTSNQEPSRLNADLTPLRISEIVLKTSQFDRLRQWYQTVFGIKPFYERTPPSDAASNYKGGKFVRATDMRLSFMRLHLQYPYTQVLAIFEVPDLERRLPGEPGLHHMQFRHPNLGELITRYERLLDIGFKPVRTANHGPGTSFYYADPDGNSVELSGPNFETEADYLAYFSSESYKNNPSGIEIDVAEYVRRFRTGTPLAELVRIP